MPTAIFDHSDLARNLLVFSRDGEAIEAYASTAQLRGLLDALVRHFDGDAQAVVPSVDQPNE